MFDSGIDGMIERLKALDSVRARLDAEAADLLDELDRSGVYAVDGHSSAKVMARHVSRLSGPTAASRERVSRMMRDLPELADAYRDGRIGVDQMHLLGRVHANARVRVHMVDAQDWFLRAARRLSFKHFQTEVRTWERLADEDGPEPNDRMHQARRVKLTQDPVALTWDMTGRFGSMMGAQIDEIFGHYTAAELAADWDKARAEHGDDACELHLPRTADQRSADALWQVFQDAAGADASRRLGRASVTTSSGTPTPTSRCSAASTANQPKPLDVDTYRCETLAGTPLEPYEAAAHSLCDAGPTGDLVDQNSTVIDLGTARAFTGNARTATKLQSHRVHTGPAATSASTTARSTTPEVTPFQRRQNQPRQRGTRLRQTQPTQRERLPSLARPLRGLAHLPPRRDRDPRLNLALRRAPKRLLVIVLRPPPTGMVAPVT